MTVVEQSPVVGPVLSPAEAAMRSQLEFRKQVFEAMTGLEVEGIRLDALIEEIVDSDFATGLLRDPCAMSLRLNLETRLLGQRKWLEELRGHGRRWPARTSPGRVLIDVAVVGENYRRLWEPVARRLGPDDTVLLLPPAAREGDVPDGFTGVRPVPVDWGAWRSWVVDGYALCLERGRSLRGLGVTETGARRLALFVALQGLRVFHAAAALDFFRPRAVLAMADRGASGAPLVAAAGRRGIPTLTLVHCPVGRTFGQTFLPLNADRLLVWGDYQKRVFVELGVSPARIGVVGCPGVEADPAVARADAADALLRRRGAPTSGLRVLAAATAPLRDEWRRQWAAEIARAARRVPEAVFLFRLHPSENKSFYAPLFAGLANVMVVGHRALGLEECVAFADVVVVHGSSVGLDALAAGKSIVALDCIPFTLATNREVVEAGAARLVASGAELAEALQSFAAQAPEWQERRRRGREFVESFFAARGEAAACRVVEEVRAVSPSQRPS